MIWIYFILSCCGTIAALPAVTDEGGVMTNSSPSDASTTQPSIAGLTGEATFERSGHAASGVKFTALPDDSFSISTVEDQVLDGYYVQAFDVNNDGRPDIVVHGLAISNAVWYENPTWKKHNISLLSEPVWSDAHDVDGDGFLDLNTSDDYGACAFNCSATDGTVSWLHNPLGTTDSAGKNWTRYQVGKVMAAHRNFFGHFNRKDRVQILVVPIRGQPPGPGGFHHPVEVTLFTAPPRDRLFKNHTWEKELVDNVTFPLAHGVQVLKNTGASPVELDVVLIGSQHGMDLLSYNSKTMAWEKRHLGDGDTADFNPKKLPSSFKGVGNLQRGFMKSGRYPFIATVEAMHGHITALYMPDLGDTAPMGLTGGMWNRTVLEVLGPLDNDPESPSYGQGPGHDVRVADFDCDGDDEILIALRGGPPQQGTLYYKLIVDEDNQLLEVVRGNLTTTSAAAASIADFDGDGAPDFATSSYYAPGYYLAKDPRTLVFRNNLPGCARRERECSAKITRQPEDPTLYDKGIKVQFDDPNVCQISTTPVWDMFGWRQRFVQLAPEAVWKLPQAEVGGRQYVKLITGALRNFRHGEPLTHPVTTPHKTRSNVVPGGVTRLQAGPEGATMAYFDVSPEAVGRRISSMTNGPMLEVTGEYSDALRWHPFGEQNPAFEGIDFWNLKGFMLTTYDHRKIAYSQWWTSGNGVDCGYHNHQEWDYFTTFGEIHMCTYVGSGSGGFQYMAPPDSAGHQEQVLIPYQAGYEHGPLWVVNYEDGKPMRNTSDQILYPWHRSVSGGSPHDPDYSYDVWVVFETISVNTGSSLNVPLNMLPTDIKGAIL